MPSKFQMYKQMADEAAKQITGSYQGWTGFLTTAARLYKYPYNEQLMIYAQRPDATACAEYDFWNKRMGRYVRRNSRGIALIDTRGTEPTLKYVFDVADTGSTDRARPVWQWQLREENTDRVSAMLEQTYDVTGNISLQEQLEQAATQLVQEYWNENRRDIFDIVADSFLEGYDDYNIEVSFRNAAVVSTTYSLMSRCGLSPETYFQHEDFLSVFDFNTPAAASILGTAVSQMSQQILRQIEATIRSFEREQSRPVQTAERMEQHDRTDLHEERRLSDPRHSAERSSGAESPGQVRDDAESISAGAQAPAVESHDSDGAALPPSAAHRRDGEQEAGAVDAGADEAERRDGRSESQRPDDLGGSDEQSESPGRGDDSERVGVQLTTDPAPQGAYQLSLFPSESEQIAYIQEAEDYKPFAFSMSIPDEDLETILRLDGNTDNARMLIATEFSKGKSNDEMAVFLQNTFHGGNGIITDSGRYSVWYAEEGIRIANGDSSRYLTSAKIVPWAEAAQRIRQLLDDGRYATNVELVEMRGHEVKTAAKHLWYMHHDMSDSAHEQYFDPSLWKGSFEEATSQLASILDDDVREVIVNETARFAAAYAADPSLMRFRLYAPDRLLAELNELGGHRRDYRSEMAELPPFKRFITEDEIAASLSRGGSVEGGKGRIYAYFKESHTPKEQAKFLKDEYGWSGGNYAVSRASHSYMGAEAKGIKLQKQDCPEIQMNWANAAKRVSELVKKDRFLTEKEKAQFEQFQEKYAAVGGVPTPKPRHGFDSPEDVIRNTSVNDYNATKELHPDSIVLYQVGDFFEIYGEDAKTAAPLLGINLTKKHIQDVGRVDMCGIPAHSLEQYVEQLRGSYDVTISAIPEGTTERKVYTMAAVPQTVEQAKSEMENEYASLVGAEFSMDGHPYKLVGFDHDEDIGPLAVIEDMVAGLDAPKRTIEPLPYIVTLIEESKEQRIELPVPNVQDQLAHYVPIVRELVEQDTAYRNACGHSDRENAMIEGNAAVRRAVLNSGDMELLKLFSDTPEFREGLHQQVFDTTYDKLHELLRPLSQDDIDGAIRAWNGDIRSKHAVVRHMEAHARDRDTAAWLSHEYGGAEKFVVRPGSPESVELPWAKVQRRIAQLIQADNFYTDQERDNFDDIDPVAIREALENGEAKRHADEMLAQAAKIAAESAVPAYERFELRMYSAPGEDDKYAVWDNNADDFFWDDDNLIHAFDTEAEYLDYFADVKQRVSEKEAAEWLYVERAKLPDLEYSVGDNFRIVSEDGSSDFKLTEVGESSVWYVFSDLPQQPPVEMNKDTFERNLRSGLLRPVPAIEIDRDYARSHLIPEETSFSIGDQTYLVDRVNYEAGTVRYQNISVAPKPGEDNLQVAPISVIRGYLEAEQTQEQLLEQAKALISNYCRGEFNSEGDFSDMTNIGLAFTTITDEEIPIQASVDLVNFRLERYLGHQDNHVITVEQYGSLRELIDNELCHLDFGTLTEISDEAIAEYQAKEDAATIIPIREFRRSTGEIVEGKDIPSLPLDAYGNAPQVFFADRREVYEAVRDFETANHISTPVIAPDGSYEDKEFLYSAYDEYVAMSHRLELYPYADRFFHLAQNESVEPYLAQIYYAKQNGLSEADIDFMIDEVNRTGRPYQVEWLSEMRSLLEDKSGTWTHEAIAATRESFATEMETDTPAAPERNNFPYSVGDTVHLEDGKPFVIEQIGTFDIQLRDPSLVYPIFRAESKENFARLMQRYPQERYTIEPVAFYPGEKTGLPYDIQIQTLRTNDPEPPAENFRITDDSLGAGGAKAKFRMNMDAINLLKELEMEGRQATPEEQEVLSKYVGWGGLADAFDAEKPNWANEHLELSAALSPEEYAAARASTLNAHYTSPTVIRAIYEAVEKMGFQTGNILEPAMGVGNFFGLLPDSMAASKLYGVELDSITGRIAKQLYPKADITVAGFETTDRKDFYDLAIGNVPFGQYQVNDRAYNKLGFSIHDYFFAKSIDQVRPGGVIAFVTSRYTMDKQSPEVRKYIAQRAELLGAIRLPNNAFKANAGTDVVSDIIFLQKRDRPIDIEPDWVHLGTNDDGFAINSYFIDNPEMVMGRQASESTRYGKQDFTVEPYEDLDLGVQLQYAIQNIRGTYTEAELPDLGENEAITESIPADPNVKNYSFTVVDGEVYYRQNSIMTKPDLNATAKERVKGLVELRDCVHKLIGQQMDGYISEEAIRETQAELNTLYDNYTAKYGLINSRANSLAFADDSSYYLLCSLEVLDEENNLKRKADMFTKRTIKAHEVVTSVDTASEALALSISEKAHVDMDYMMQLTGKDEETLVSELRGVIFQNPQFQRKPRAHKYQTADEYLSGNVREKLRDAIQAHNLSDVDYSANIEALKAAQPKDLDASEIEVRLGATWIDPDYIREFMWETFETPFYLRRSIDVNYSSYTAEWNITGKSSVSYSNINAYMTYGTDRANAYKILEDTLNLRDVRIYDTVTDPDGKERRVLNSKETTLAQQKQQAIKDAFRDWIWKDPERRHTLVARYNELFNSTRPREYDGSHITFSGMNPEIKLREHQLNAVAHVLYGGNTLLAHEVGAGKTFEMVAAAMESKRLGLCHKSLFVVPNHLTEQWASEFLRLYPSANILVATKKDFETRNRKKFCGRIATGDYDAVIIGHSQFERIPVSQERQERLLQEQIWEVEEGIQELRASRAEKFTIKSLERTKRSLETRLKKLQDSSRKDDVVTFEQLGIDRLYVDEAHNYKNLFLYTKMRNVAGLSTTDAQKSSDMLLKCRYIDEITDNKGIVFATGTPVSNSMTELYTMMRYLQHDTLQRKGLAHFDCWASTFGETQTAIELAPEGTGYRARTRFAKFFNLPELMTLFKEAADIKTADQLNLPTPTPIYHNEVAQPTEIQREMVQELSERAARVHAQLVDPSQDNMLKIVRC